MIRRSCSIQSRSISAPSRARAPPSMRRPQMPHTAPIRRNSTVPAPFHGVGRLNHVAIAVPDLKQASELYRSTMIAKVSDPVPQPEHGVTTVFIDLGNTKIELLHPLGEQSPISNFLQKNKSGGVHHICLEVDDINAAVQQMQLKGIKVLDPKPKIGAHGKPVVFLHPKDLNGVLVELEQM